MSTKSSKAKCNSLWVATPSTRRNHEAIFNKKTPEHTEDDIDTFLEENQQMMDTLAEQEESPYPKLMEDCECTGDFTRKMGGYVCKDCGVFRSLTAYKSHVAELLDDLFKESDV